ncbi:N-6 DNA methylase [Lachnotalea glycerini]|uniref:site-specific DNA-methyltransferase (adenine-specific) n=1 Tax=Lachnotalea glycerini TaxID=1763509 RepID=A0A371JBS4_9FIRM|nr:N-6 DNA methylase [Lachnotalea glycerini]RDY30128.1 SAM-dependent DNA methyltransferase [Lachnotalea glycerini]
MKSNNLKVTEITSIIKFLEKELSGWIYYNAIRGRSLVATVYLIFLKYLSDNEIYPQDKIFPKMEDVLENNGKIDGIFVNGYLREKLAKNSANEDIIVKYAEEIHFENMPREFINILNLLSKFDLSNEAEMREVVMSLVMVLSTADVMRPFKDEVEPIDISLILSAAELLETEDNMDVYDCSCGVGTLLAMSSNTGCNIYGQEENIDKAVIASILLRLAGAIDPIIEVGDVLQNPITAQYKDILFDRIISSPPINDKNINAQKLFRMDYINEFLFRDSLSESGAWIYARHIIKKLKIDGKGILIAPISILSREGVTQEDRIRLAERESIEVIIQLPVGIASTSARQCIIVLRKGHDEYTENTNIFMIDLSSKKGSDYIKASNSIIDYKKLAELVFIKEEIEGISRLVTLSEVNDSDMNFTPAIYFRSFVELLPKNEGIDETQEVLEIHRELLKQYEQTEKELNFAIDKYMKIRNNKLIKEEC